jgi:hypothetical protein
MWPPAGSAANPAAVSTVTGSKCRSGTDILMQIIFAFCSPPCYFPARRFQQVLGVTPCSKIETCHPEVTRRVPSGVGGMRMSEGSQARMFAAQPARRARGTANPSCAPHASTDLVNREKSGSGIDRMVIYPFYYVYGQRLGAFPRLRSCSKGFPTFLHRGVKWQTTKQNSWKQRLR